MKIIELVIVNSETDLLLLRTRMLAGAIDLHVVAEGTRTFQGERKPLHLDGVGLPSSISRFVIDLPEVASSPWYREKLQRDSLLLFAAGFAEPDDLMILCDVDEFVDPSCLPRLIEETSDGIVDLEMRQLYYGVSWEDPGGWHSSRAFRFRDAPRGLSHARIRRHRSVANCGWHVSFAGGIDRMWEKVRSYSHEELSVPAAWAELRRGPEQGIGPSGEGLVRRQSPLPTELVAFFDTLTG